MVETSPSQAHTWMILTVFLGLAGWYYYNKFLDSEREYINLHQQYSAKHNENEKNKVRIKELQKYQQDVSRTFHIMDNEIKAIHDTVKKGPPQPQTIELDGNIPVPSILSELFSGLPPEQLPPPTPTPTPTQPQAPSTQTTQPEPNPEVPIPQEAPVEQTPQERAVPIPVPPPLPPVSGPPAPRQFLTFNRSFHTVRPINFNQFRMTTQPQPQQPVTSETKETVSESL